MIRRQPGEVVVDVAGLGFAGRSYMGGTTGRLQTIALVMGHEIVGWRQDTGQPVAVNRW